MASIISLNLLTLVNLLYLTYLLMWPTKLLQHALQIELKLFLICLIHDSQTGFIKGRFIRENTRMIYDVIDVAQDKHIPGMILLMNFEKAFDSISWKFIYNTLHYFNFGPDLIKWVSVLYNRTKLCVIQNGIFFRY